MMPDDIYEEIYKIHTDQLDLEGVATSDRPVFVVFSAIPGSGKSELSRRLESDYGYLRITNKLIRESIEQSGYNDVVIGEYTIWFLNKLTKTVRPNIVFDRNIDQWYSPSKSWASDNNYRYILVSINVSIDILKKRLFQREGTMTSKAHEVLDFYSKQHTEMRNYIKAAIYLNDNYDIDAAAKSISNV